MRRAVALALGAGAGVAMLGCGFGPGSSGGEARVTVTRDFGTARVGAASARSLPGSETVMRFLRRHFDVRTSYGGRYVSSIAGLGEGSERGRPVAWLYYLNGIEAPKGAAATPVHTGDDVWWDRHDYGAAQRIPAVVGAFPAPFTGDLAGKRPPARLECAADTEAACELATKRLEAVGVPTPRSVPGVSAGDDTVRVLVGTWADLRRDGAAAPVGRGPGASGVYARPAADGRSIALLDSTGASTRTVGAGSGLVAATRFGDREPVWVVTGTDPSGVRAAAALLDRRSLERRFAVVAVGGRAVPVPEVRR